MKTSLKVEVQRDGSSIYRTREGDMVDHVAFLFYGTHTGTTEVLYEANPHLTSLPMVLPDGIVIAFPAPPAPRPEEGRIKLWE